MPSASQSVRVDLAERSYDIEIGAGNLADAGRFLKDRGKVSQAIIFTDENVQEPHAVKVAESLVGESIEVAIVAVAPGEKSKSVEVAAETLGRHVGTRRRSQDGRRGRRRRRRRRPGRLHRRDLRPGTALPANPHDPAGPGR